MRCALWPEGSEAEHRDEIERFFGGQLHNPQQALLAVDGAGTPVGFVETGTFREGTMLALIGQGIGTNATPARQGQFATDVHMVEMAVKDSKRVAEGWAYYGFGGPMAGGYRTSAAPQPKANCYDCHATHAARDNVFTQFYGLLNEATPRNDKRRY